MKKVVTPGSLVRRLLGDRVFARIVGCYRAIFVDLDEVASCVPELPPGAELLDIGGGDGALLEHVLRRQPRLRASLVDPSPTVGLSLAGERRNRVRLFPGTDVRDGGSRGVPVPDAIVIADVLHHVPKDRREGFLRDVAAFCGRAPRYVVVKEVAAQGWRARLGLLSDWYVTGDRHVELIPPDEVRRLMALAFPGLAPRETQLFERDAPNYCLVFQAPQPEAAQTQATPESHAVRFSLPDATDRESSSATSRD